MKNNGYADSPRKWGTNSHALFGDEGTTRSTMGSTKNRVNLGSKICEPHTTKSSEWKRHGHAAEGESDAGPCIEPTNLRMRASAAVFICTISRPN
jgi:hypothetical protein